MKLYVKTPRRPAKGTGSDEYQYRLCPLKSNLTEACMQQTSMPFAGNSNMVLSNGTIIKLKSTFVSEGTLPVGSTWQMNLPPTWPGCRR